MATYWLMQQKSGSSVKINIKKVDDWSEVSSLQNGLEILQIKWGIYMVANISWF